MLAALYFSVYFISPQCLTARMVFISFAGSLFCQLLILVSSCNVNAAGFDSTSGKQWTKAIIQKKAPHWEGVAVIDGEFQSLKLSDFQGKYLVLMFYPLDFTFVCPTEILAFNDRLSEFKELNAEVVVCSVDSHYTHLAWTNTSRKDGGLGPIKIPMLSDLNRQISQDYGVYLPELGHTLRGLFIIDKHSILRQTTINDLPVGRSVDETLRLLQAFQYTDAHGEVCPANWKPGGETNLGMPMEFQTRIQTNIIMKKIRYNSRIAAFSDMAVPIVWIELAVDGLPGYIIFLLYLVVFIVPGLLTAFIVICSIAGVSLLIFSTVTLLTLAGVIKINSSKKTAYSSLKIAPMLNKKSLVKTKTKKNSIMSAFTAGRKNSVISVHKNFSNI